MKLKSLIVFIIFCMAVVFGTASDLPDKAGTADEPALSHTMDNCGVSNIPSSERQALINLYNSTNGDYWTDNTNWRKPGYPTQFNDPGTECSWEGVLCSSDCSHVIAIYLGSHNLNGTLPDLSAFTELQALELSYNNISGSIPATINNLTELVSLNLSYNSLGGGIPNLSSLSVLEALALHNNQLSGTIPASLDNLDSLRTLDLGYNQLTGSIPNLSGLSQLKRLGLLSNQLTGGIPTWLNQLTSLEDISFGHNPLGGTIPDLSNLTALKSLGLYNCQLTGNIPAWINQLTNLIQIALGYNYLEGSVPALGNLTQLVSLEMSSNSLSGTFPDIGSLTALKFLVINHNEFTGAIPDLYGLTQLQQIYLDHNRFSGNFPGEICTLTNLDYLYLEGNMLKGAIPSALVNLTNLQINGSTISWNGLYTDDPTLIAFLDTRMPNWELTQTIPPENLSVSDITDESLVLHWDPILYQANTGGYKIYYTSDSMGSYYLLTTINDKSTGSYTVPTVLNPGTRYTFAIKTFTAAHSNNKNEIISDYSSTVSATTTEAATITVTSPNGGESWAGGSTQTITWTSTGTIANVNIYYTGDNGISYQQIILSTPNDGSFDWTVPDAPSGWCRVKIIETGGSVVDESDGMFTITPAPSITVTSPNGGENWAPGSTHDITWTSTGAITIVDIALSTDNGATWTTLFAASPNDGTQSITLPAGDSAVCLIRIGETGGTVYDVSDGVFTISTPHSVTITSPNGGENWAVGSTQTITWTSTGNLGNLRLRYSIDNGANWITIAVLTTNPGSYAWVVPDAPSSTCKVRIREIGQPAVDDSDAVFTIYTPHSVTVTSPNGGENWAVGSVQNVTWTSTGIFSYVDIALSTNSGVSWTAVANGTANDGSHSITVPSADSSNCLIRVSETGGSVSDVSNGVFSIYTPHTITVVSPNGGESWLPGSTHPITWTSTGAIAYVDLSYSLDNGSTWVTIANSRANTGSYYWTLPAASSNTCRVRVAESGGGASDISDYIFSILEPSTFTIISPNGGEVWSGGSTQTILWTCNCTYTVVNLSYSLNNGATWTDIAVNTSNSGRYDWTVPRLEQTVTTCLVKVTTSFNNISDTSDGTFTILGEK